MIIFSEKVDYRKLDKSLQKTCDIFDKAIDIDIVATSGLRSPTENSSVGGVPTSSHLKGLAIDLNCPDSKTRFKIVFSALIAGFKRIGIGKNHIHLDIDETKPFPIIFFDNM